MNLQQKRMKELPLNLQFFNVMCMKVLNLLFLIQNAQECSRSSDRQWRPPHRLCGYNTISKKF